MSTQRAASRTAPPIPHFIPLQHAIHIIAKQKPGCGSLEKMHKKIEKPSHNNFSIALPTTPAILLAPS